MSNQHIQSYTHSSQSRFFWHSASQLLFRALKLILTYGKTIWSYQTKCVNTFVWNHTQRVTCMVQGFHLALWWHFWFQCLKLFWAELDADHQKYVNVDFVAFVAFVWGLSSHSRIFHAYGDVNITNEGLQFLIYALHSWPLSSEVRVL